MANKRQQKRFIYRCETEFNYNETTYRGISSNFSLGGLFLRTSYPAHPDTILDMVIHLPDGSYSKITGKVIRAIKPALGRVIGIPIRDLKHGMGIKVIKKDINYLHFIRSLLG
ncbi:MAG: PilZ domain-containing protein [Nitrospirae bacterium]|nr:PilZ domain-containing protein [Nitrospirota bacterium]